MTRAMFTTASRRVLLSRLLVAAAARPVLGITLAGTSTATKKGKNTIASIGKRLVNAKDTCELIGNRTLDTVTLPSGTRITYCEGGTHDGTRCKHTSQESSCTWSHTGQPGDCTQALTAGAAEDPTDGGGSWPVDIAISARDGAPRRRKRRH